MAMTSNELEQFKQSILDSVRVMMQTTGQVTQYVGARYEPLFAEPFEWSDQKEYEPLTIVMHQGNSFTSRQFVPKGIGIDNSEFWASTGNYNAQIEQYRLEVAAFDARITAAQNTADSKAPINHASESTEYGVGNAVNYGHVKLADDGSMTSGANDGVAATPKMVSDKMPINKYLPMTLGQVPLFFTGKSDVANLRHSGFTICNGKIYQAFINGDDTEQYLNIFNESNGIDVKTVKFTDMGHFNSMTYKDDYIYAFGSNGVVRSNNDFTTKQDYLIIANLNKDKGCSVACDHATDKLYAFYDFSFKDITNPNNITDVVTMKELGINHVQDFTVNDDVLYISNILGFSIIAYDLKTKNSIEYILPSTTIDGVNRLFEVEGLEFYNNRLYVSWAQYAPSNATGIICACDAYNNSYTASRTTTMEVNDTNHFYAPNKMYQINQDVIDCKEIQIHDITINNNYIDFTLKSRLIVYDNGHINMNSIKLFNCEIICSSNCSINLNKNTFNAGQSKLSFSAIVNGDFNLNITSVYESCVFLLGGVNVNQIKLKNTPLEAGLFINGVKKI